MPRLSPTPRLCHAAAWLCLLCWVGNTQTVIRLNNGKSFSGTIVEHGENFLTLDTDGRHLKILRSLVASLDSTTPAPARRAAPTAPENQHQFTLSNGRTITGVLVTDQGNFVKILVDSKQINVLKSIITHIDGQRYPAASPTPPDSAAHPQPTVVAPAPPAELTPVSQPPTREPHTLATRSAAPDQRRPQSTPAVTAPKASTPAEATLVAAPPSAQRATESRQPAPPHDSTTLLALMERRRVDRERPVPPAVPLITPERMVTELRKLVEKLGSRNALYQTVAALRLAELGPAATEATPYLIRTLGNTRRVRVSTESDTETTPAQAAAVALVAIGAPSVGGLVHALSHSEPMVRKHAAWALGELKDAASVTALLAASEDPEDPVRSAVIEALGKLREPRAIPILVTLMNLDPSPLVRTTAESSLRYLTEIPLLIDGVEDASPLVRDNSAYILWLMTAKEFRTNAIEWRSWWRQQAPPDTLRPASRPTRP